MFTASGLVLLTLPHALETSCSHVFIQALLLHGSLPEDEQTSTLSFGESASSEQQLVTLTVILLLCMSHIQSVMVMTYTFYCAIEDFNSQSSGPEYGRVFRSEGNLNCWT